MILSAGYPPVLGCFSHRGCTLWDPESLTLGTSFIFLVYNVAAKEELLSRGLLPHEVCTVGVPRTAHYAQC